MNTAYDYTDILARWDTLPAIKIRYAEDEVGWAVPLSPQHACIANISLSVNLRLYDIVKLESPDDPDDWPLAGELLQCYHTETIIIRYPKKATPGRRALAAIRAILTAVGGKTEGTVAGFLMANVPPQCDVSALLTTLDAVPGVMAQVVVYEDDTFLLY
jgi:hypothetical protein